MTSAVDPRGTPSTAPPSVPSLLEPFPALTPPVSTAGAAVTIVLRAGATEPEVLLIERAPNPADPASGQVALPGGRVDDGDGSLTFTALRELEEEVGLSEADLVAPLRFVGTADAYRFGLRVGVFAVELGPRARGAAPRSRVEVAHVFWVPRSELLRTRRVIEETSRGAMEVPATVYDGHILWGFTRRVLREFFRLPPEGDSGGPLFTQPRDPLDSPSAPSQADQYGRHATD
ncbi:MAG TPA: CoA pyrophosphatase [Thermoplasmata archaeon]|nr:CoA pyrophosphatase [Thermoplasmata archaeon]